MIVHTIQTCDDIPVEVYVVPRLLELGAASPRADTWRTCGVFSSCDSRASRIGERRWVCKRIFDLAVAAVALVIVAPVLAAAAVAVVRPSEPSRG